MSEEVDTVKRTTTVKKTKKKTRIHVDVDTDESQYNNQAPNDEVTMNGLVRVL